MVGDGRLTRAVESIAKNEDSFCLLAQGAEKRVFELGRRLVDRGHEVHWQLRWWDGPKDISHDGVYLHGVGEWDELYTNGRRSIREGLYFGLILMLVFR